MTLDKKFIDQFVNVTVKAASAASLLVGKNDKNAADQAAVDSMRTELNKIDTKSRKMSAFTYSLLAGFSLFTVTAALIALPWVGHWPQS